MSSQECRTLTTKLSIEFSRMADALDAERQAMADGPSHTEGLPKIADWYRQQAKAMKDIDRELWHQEQKIAEQDRLIKSLAARLVHGAREGEAQA